MYIHAVWVMPRPVGHPVGHAQAALLTDWQEPSASQVSALFHIASTNAPPPLPDNISADCRSFLLLCFIRWASRLQLLQLPLAVLQGGRRHPLHCHALADKPLHSNSKAGSPADQAACVCLMTCLSWGDHSTAGREDWG